MNPLDWIAKSGFGAALRAGAGFVAVSIIGTVGLVAVALVLWAASLTPFGLWAALPVIVAGAAVALVLWRQRHDDATKPRPGVTSLHAPTSLSWSAGSFHAATARQSDKSALDRIAPPRVKLIGPVTAVLPRAPRVTIREPAVPDVQDLKRTFDQAFAAEQFDDAEHALAELAKLPDQAAWTRRKQRLVRQQRARS